MITYQVEDWASYRASCDELWVEHYAEIARDKNRMPMRPDEGFYRSVESAGALQIVTARDAGRMVGYVLTVVKPHPHYADVLCGFEDAYFLSETHRKGMTGVRLIKAALGFLEKRGVRKVFFMTKSFKNMGRIFEHLGFSQCDVVYTRWIGE